MTKYIVKNCTSYHWGGCYYDGAKFECCSKNADCPIKQVARIASDYYDIYCNHCVTKNCENCHFDLAKVILQTLDVQEVE